jgi:hypothetical protein
VVKASGWDRPPAHTAGTIPERSAIPVAERPHASATAPTPAQLPTPTMFVVKLQTLFAKLETFVWMPFAWRLFWQVTDAVVSNRALLRQRFGLVNGARRDETVDPLVPTTIGTVISDETASPDAVRAPKVLLVLIADREAEAC